MQIDLRTVAIKPQRNTFDHLARRFGDKQANRYQEATYDVQPSKNLHYRPSWDPERQLWDASRTAVVMEDWYAFKDPRQFYYATWTNARERQQEHTEQRRHAVPPLVLSSSCVRSAARPASGLMPDSSAALARA